MDQRSRNRAECREQGHVFRAEPGLSCPALRGTNPAHDLPALPVSPSQGEAVNILGQSQLNAPSSGDQIRKVRFQLTGLMQALNQQDPDFLYQCTMGSWKGQFHLNSVSCFFPSLFNFPMNVLWIAPICSPWRSANFHIPAVPHDVLQMRATHLASTSLSDASHTLLPCSFPVSGTAGLTHREKSLV